MFHLLGIDPHAEVRDTNGRPLAVTEGKVIDGIIA
jgi:hypothetical protein